MDRNDILRSIENHRTGLAPLLKAYEDLTKATKATKRAGEGGGGREGPRFWEKH